MTELDAGPPPETPVEDALDRVDGASFAGRSRYRPGRRRGHVPGRGCGWAAIEADADGRRRRRGRDGGGRRRCRPDGRRPTTLPRPRSRRPSVPGPSGGSSPTRCGQPASGTPSPCPGESFLGLLDALGDAGIRVVAARHEGGAAFMAEAHGQLTGRPAACLATRAVGGANLAIGIHTARQDSSPMFVIVGQVERDFRGREAFQEIDQVGTLGGLAKWAVEPRRAEDVPAAMAQAVREALTGRPGPVLVSLPGGPPRRGDRARASRRSTTGAGPRDGRRHPRRHRAARLGPAAGHPGGGGRAARPDVDGARPVRRAAPRPGHRGVAPRRRHLERPRALSRHGGPRGARVDPPATRRCRCAPRAREPAERGDELRLHAAAARPALGARRSGAQPLGRPAGGGPRDHLGRPRVPAGGQRAPAERGRARCRARGSPRRQQRPRPGDVGGRHRRGRHAVGRPGRPSRPDRRDASPGAPGRGDPDDGCRQFRGLGRAGLPVPAPGHVPRFDIGSHGLRPSRRRSPQPWSTAIARSWRWSATAAWR